MKLMLAGDRGEAECIESGVLFGLGEAEYWICIWIYF